MQKDPLEDFSFFQLQSDKIILNFQEITTSNIEITSKRTYTQTVLFENYILFFGEKLCTQTNILAFDLELMKWTAISVDAKQSKAFIEGSDCRLCYSPLFSGIFFHGMYKQNTNTNTYQPFFEYLKLKVLDDKEQTNLENQFPFKTEFIDLTSSNIPFRRCQSSNFIEDRMYLFGGVGENYSSEVNLMIVHMCNFLFYVI